MGAAWRRRLRIWLPAVGVLVLVVAGAYLWRSGSGRAKPGGPETEQARLEGYKLDNELALRKRNVRFLYWVLSRYESVHGALPHSDAGQDYALYRLKPVAPFVGTIPSEGQGLLLPLGPEIFDVDYPPFKGDKASWDDWDRRVAHPDFDYLNEARALDRSQPKFAVYAEKPLPALNGRRVVFCNGAMLWIPRQDKYFGSPLGRSWKQLHAAGPVEEPQPGGKPSADILGPVVIQAADMNMALRMYLHDHGALPYSERGAEYALYKLKPYVSGAELFDGFYTHIENGVAYWNDEDKKLENSDYDYLNRPSFSGTDASGQEVAVLVERWGATFCRRRMVVFMSGPKGFIGAGSQNSEHPLGKTESELELP